MYDFASFSVAFERTSLEKKTWKHHSWTKERTITANNDKYIKEK